MWSIKDIGNSIRSNVEEIFLVITALLGIGYVILSHAHLSNFQPPIAEWTGVMLALIGIALFVRGMEAKRNIRDLDQKIQRVQDVVDRKSNEQTLQIIQSLQGVHYRSFKSSVEFVRYLGERVLQAEKSVDDLTWIPELAEERRGREGLDADKNYHAAIATAATKVMYREIFIFTDASKIEKLKFLIDRNVDFYRCGYFEQSNIPRPAFTIIDRVEVLLYASPEVFCSIRHPELTKAFNQYFAKLWSETKKIKDGKSLNKREYEHVLAKYDSVELATVSHPERRRAGSVPHRQ